MSSIAMVQTSVVKKFYSMTDSCLDKAAMVRTGKDKLYREHRDEKDLIWLPEEQLEGERPSIYHISLPSPMVYYHCKSFYPPAMLNMALVRYCLRGFENVVYFDADAKELKTARFETEEVDNPAEWPPRVKVATPDTINKIHPIIVDEMGEYIMNALFLDDEGKKNLTSSHQQSSPVTSVPNVKQTSGEG